MRRFFNTVIFPILRIFNGLLQTKRKKVYTNRTIKKRKEQKIYSKGR